MNRCGRILVATAIVAINLVFALGSPEVAHATTITVNTATDPVWNTETGNFPTDGLCSLRAAIIAAETNSNAHDVDCATGLPNELDVITLPASLRGSTFTLTADPDGGGPEPFMPIHSGGPIWIVGDTTDPADFVISGGGAVRPFTVGYLNVARGDLTLANLTIAGGDGTSNGVSAGANDGFGGAIYMGDAGPEEGGSTLTLDNVVLRNNSATSRGGAIYGTMPTITNNGGAYIDNSALDNGGAVAVDSGPFTLNGYAVLFEDNSAGQFGGAIYSNPGNDEMLVHLERSLALNNTATSAGGVVYVDSTRAGKVFEFHDSTASGNSGVFFSAANTQSFEMLRTTLVDNAQNWRGGEGLIANSIVNGGACLFLGVGGITGVRNLINSGGSGCGDSALDDIGDVTNLSPTLAQNGGPEVQRTYALLPGSNAIDNGSPAYCGTVDARSVARGADGNGVPDDPQPDDCDIGAYEFVRYVVNFLTGTPVVNEGAGTASIPVRLRILDASVIPLPAPLSVSVALAAGSTARIGTGPLDDVSVSGNAVTFPAGSGDDTIANLVVTLNDDDIAEAAGEIANFELTGSTTAGVAIAEPRSASVVIQDNDQAGIEFIQTGGNTVVTEVDPTLADSINVRLQSRPDYVPNTTTPADVEMTIRPDRDCVIEQGGEIGTQASPLVRTILNANWNVGFDITVRAVDDDYDEDFRDESAPHTCEIRFTFTSLDPVYAATQDAIDVSVQDDDTAAVITQLLTTTQRAEDSTDPVMWTVSLNSEPDPGKPLPGIPRDPTTVIITPSMQCDAGNGPGQPRSIVFDEFNWSLPQTVEIRPAQDFVVELAHACEAPVTISSGDPVYADLDDAPTFANTPQPMGFDIQDYDPPTITDDPPFVDVTVGSLAVDEAAPAVADSLSVVLRRAPLDAPVFVTLQSEVDASIGGPQLVTSAGGSPATATSTLVFDADNWSVPQTVLVTPVDDDYDESDPLPDTHPGPLTLTMSSAAVGFSDSSLRRIVVDGTEHSGAVTLTAAIADEDVSGIDVTWPGGVSEGLPGVDVSLTFTSHPFHDVDLTFTTDGQCTINGSTVYSTTIAADDWNVGETLTVAAVDDDELEETTHSCSIALAVDSDDAKYAALDDQVTIPVVDNEEATVQVTAGGSLTVVEGGADDTFDVVLGTQPASNVTVTFTAASGQATTVVATFTPDNWDEPQTLTVEAIDDAIDEASPFAEALVMSITSTAPGYRDNATLIVDTVPALAVLVDVYSDDVSGITAAGALGPIAESGGTDSYTLVLTSEPVADVTVTFTAAGLCSVAPPSHTFDAANWDTPVQVTVTAGNDDIDGPATCTVQHTVTSGDDNYDGLVVADATTSIVDDDTAGVIVGTPAGSVAERGATSTTYTVVLATEPTADVGISVTPDAQLSTSAPIVLTFTADDWDVPQVVTVNAVDDTAMEPTPHDGTVSHSVTSADPNYDGITVADVTIAIADDETQTVVDVSPANPNDSAVTSVTATVTGGPTTPTGSVQFSLDGAGIGAPVALVEGVATISLGMLAAGTYDVVASYSGDATHAPSIGSATFTVTRRPVADDDVLLLSEDSPPVAVGVLIGDVDLDGDTLTVTDHTEAEHGTVECTASDCTYAPDPDFNGTDSFEYTITDSTGLSDSATVTIVVTPVDDPPFAPPVPIIFVPNGQPTTFELLDGATDVDGDLLVIVSFGQPAHGSVDCTPAGTCTYTPHTGFAGADQFGYVVGDGRIAATSSGLVEAGTVSAVAQLQVQPAPSTTAGPSTTTTTTLAPGATATTTRPGQLPATGGDPQGSLAAAVAAIALGTGLLLGARRRAAVVPARRDRR